VGQHLNPETSQYDTGVVTRRQTSVGVISFLNAHASTEGKRKYQNNETFRRKLVGFIYRQALYTYLNIIFFTAMHPVCITAKEALVFRSYKKGF
jgi:hypothetical protein